MSSERQLIRTVEAARDDLGPERSSPPWLENSHSLPFGALSDDEFEILCYLLLKAEYPNDEIVYYGKTADLGRDIVHRRSDGSSQLVQCKRHSRNIGVGVVRDELAKLVVNVFEKRISEAPQEVCFYVVPDLSGHSKDLIRDQSKWKAIARNQLQKYLGKVPSDDLIAFAESWWPLVPPQEDKSLTIRCTAQPELLEEFFRIRKVIDGSINDVQKALDAQTKSIVNALSDSPAPATPAIRTEAFHDQIDAAVAWMKEGKTEVAIAFLMRLKTRDWDEMPERAKYRTLANLGHCHVRQEDFDQALIDFREACSHQPQDVDGHGSLHGALRAVTAPTAHSDGDRSARMVKPVVPEQFSAAYAAEPHPKSKRQTQY
jgi:tetratricopeptide (TPR) repeat protein